MYYFNYHYYLNILIQNVNILTNIQKNYFNYQQLYDVNRKLQQKNSYYNKEIKNLKRKLLDCSNTSDKIKFNPNSQHKEIQDLTKNKPRKKYKFMHYPISPFSWSEENVNQTLKTITSIEDIIKLKNYWPNLRHNPILQKLYYLIPPLIKLNNMIGLKTIKSDLFKKIIYYVQYPSDNDYLHTVITGPPGVGKTEFAKIYGEIFVNLGILKSDKFIEIKRDDLVGEYLGQTSIKTKNVLESAMDGVLFLDEAYSLGNEEKRDFYSKEAIDMINHYLSEKKGQFMFIIAGYKDEIESCLLSYNKGMERRFHTYYNIDDYTLMELKEIFISKINKSIYKLDIPDNILSDFFCDKNNSFDNYGGDIEKLFTEIKQIQALRTFNNNYTDKNIIIDDIKIAYSKLFSIKIYIFL